MLNGLSDIGIGHVSILYQRYLLVDYLSVIYRSSVYLMSKKPEPTPPTGNVLKPFPTDLWAVVSATLVLSTLAFVLAQNLLDGNDWNVNMASLTILLRQCKESRLSVLV